MKKLLSVLFLMVSVSLFAQTYTKEYTAKEWRKAQKWTKKGKWRKGFDKAEPAEGVNLVDFMYQYKKNTAEWDAVFSWLQITDLDAIPNGNYPIPGTQLEAKVQVDTNHFTLADLQAGKGSESHRKKIDFMFCVGGIEGFAAIDHESSEVKTPYNDKKDRIDYRFAADKLKLYESVPGKFNIMFPDDWHIAKVVTSRPDQ
ncbi:MAG: YhcH/YjgK/YiaL family protein, partial [Prevotellaceae bacterium]|nr:YhcH/YjgK/YiaL family protein [Prevotellaceae bacterium]